MQHGLTFVCGLGESCVFPNLFHLVIAIFDIAKGDHLVCHQKHHNFYIETVAMVAIDMVAMLGPWLHSSASRTLAEEETEFGWDKYANSREEHVIKAEYICVFLVLLITTLMLQFYVGHKWHITWLPEAGATVLLGMFISGLIRAAGNDTSSGNTAYLGFDSTVFFIGFLPPIIYNAGYSLKRRLFFANMGGIVSLAIIGTSFSAIVVGFGLYAMGKAKASSDLSLMEGLTFGSLISATDPVSTLAVFTELKVDPTLFYLVFGESVRCLLFHILIANTFDNDLAILSPGPERCHCYHPFQNFREIRWLFHRP